MAEFSVLARARALYTRAVDLEATPDGSSDWERARDPGPFLSAAAGVPDLFHAMETRGWTISEDGLEPGVRCNHRRMKDGSQSGEVVVAVRAWRRFTVEALDPMAALRKSAWLLRCQWPEESGEWRLTGIEPVACSEVEPSVPGLRP